MLPWSGISEYPGRLFGTFFFFNYILKSTQKYKIWVDFHFFSKKKSKKHPIWQKLDAFPPHTPFLLLLLLLFFEMGRSLANTFFFLALF